MMSMELCIIRCAFGVGFTISISVSITQKGNNFIQSWNANRRFCYSENKKHIFRLNSGLLKWNYLNEKENDLNA